jgi:NADH-quinone oxidoreductase subunit L/multicomponent Na+:H+ antiporter subunit D
VLKLLYFWPIVYAAFFGERDRSTAASRHAFAPAHAAPDGGVAQVPPPAPERVDPARNGSEEAPADVAAEATGWERLPLGRETAAALLVPVLFTAAMAVAFGVVPTAMPFWDLATTAVTEVFG